jgi:hypothetical protein
MNGPEPIQKSRRLMPDSLRPVLVFAAVLGAWFVLNRWILPKLGVAT